MSKRDNRYRETIKYLEQDKSLPKAVIFDIDGTLAVNIGRSPYAWMKVGEDIPKLPIVRLANLYRLAGYKIIIFSGRDSVCKEITQDWLEKNLLFSDFGLYMRNRKDDRKDSIIKKELFDLHIRDKYYIEIVVDDRQQVVDMWRKEIGLTCLQVDYGDF